MAPAPTGADVDVALRRCLADLSGLSSVVTDPAVLSSYRRDQAPEVTVDAGSPAAVIRPTSHAEVERVMRAASTHGVPVVPRGAGSGLSGGANAVDGCIVLGLERMTAVAVDATGMTATAEAGVINATLAAAAREEELWYPPDPASWEFSTIGGNVATNAGGLCCVKYGVTRDSLLELDMVLADGTSARLGRRTRKGVAGYDLVSLLCGSEGTLAIVTRATVQLRPLPPAAHTLAASFPTLESAGAAVVAIVRATRPSLLELMDAATVRAVEAFQPMELDLDAAAMLFARVDTGRHQGALDIALLEEICTAHDATLVVTSDEEAEGRMLTAARRLAYPSLERQGATLLDDVGVPIPAIPALLAGIAAIAARQDVQIATFGHAGDGNMHPTIVFDREDPASVQAARAAFGDIVRLALSLGGTITGEHGVGLLKQGFVADDLGTAHGLHRAVKDAFDPSGILNPGKGI